PSLHSFPSRRSSDLGPYPNLIPSPNYNNFEYPVTWEVYVLEFGKWRKTKGNEKTGNIVSYTFLQRSLNRKGIRILAKRGEQIVRSEEHTSELQSREN